MKTITAYLCTHGCGKYLRSRSGMRKHEKGCYWNPETKSCASCGNQIKDTRPVKNPNDGGKPGSNDYAVKTRTCAAFGTDLYNFNKLRTGCERWVK